MNIFIYIMSLIGLLVLEGGQITGPAYTGAIATSGPPGICGVYTDSFAGSGGLSGNWTVSTASGYVPVVRVSGTAQPNTSSDPGIAVYTAGVSGGDQCSQIVINGTTGDFSASGPSVLMSVAGDGYQWVSAINSLYKVVGGAGVSVIISDCPAATGGDVLRVTVTASTHTLTCTNITSGLSGTPTVDSTYTTGYVGFLIDHRVDAGIYATNFGGS